MLHPVAGRAQFHPLPSTAFLQLPKHVPLWSHFGGIPAGNLALVHLEAIVVLRHWHHVPGPGLCEQLRAGGRKCAFFYNWEELRDLSRPESLAFSYFVSPEFDRSWEETNEMVTKNAISYIEEDKPDFAFVYLGLTDAVGHGNGWMGEEYMKACSRSLEEIRRIVERFREDYTIIVTADHGGHGRNHGSDDREDMLIPVICLGPDFPTGKVLEDVGICDIAPTIAGLAEVSAAPEWEGKNLITS